MTQSLQADSAFDKKMLEIGYLGAFYGLSEQAQTIFSLYAHGKSKEAARLGAALALLGSGRYVEASEALEEIVSQWGATLPEARVFLVFAYRKAHARADRVEQLLAEIGEAQTGPVAEALPLVQNL